MAKLSISVIIPSYRRPLELRRCLSAVLSQSRRADEVLVVSREGDSETQQVISSFHDKNESVRPAYVSQPGLIAALNCGLDQARGDLLVFTDDDAEAQMDWLERIAHSFMNESVGAIGGRDWLQLPDEPALFMPSEALRTGLITWYGAHHGNHHCPVRGHTRKVMFLKGVNMAFRRDVLGNFRIDTRLRGSGAQVGSELDLCLYVRRSRRSIVFDDRILVKHYCAARPMGDARNDLTGSVWPDICFNTHFLVAKHLRLPWAMAHLCNRLLFGFRNMPGLLASLRWRLNGDRQVISRMRKMTQIAFIAFRDGRLARTAATHVDLRVAQPEW